jgi:hypothetical protein
VSDSLSVVTRPLALVVCVALSVPCAAMEPGVVPLAAQRSASDFGPQSSPEAAFAAYLRVLEEGVRSPDLGLYTPATRDLLRARVVTRTQQRNELAAIRTVHGTRTVRQQGDLAVIRFDSRQVPPYFLRRQRDGWTLDLAAASRVIRFDQRNQWFIDDRTTEFAFGF